MATYISSGSSAVSNGKTLIDPIITQTGRVIISSGGVLSGAVVSNGGQVQISSGGSDKESYYMNGGVLIVSNGGVCSDPGIQQGATVHVSAGRLFNAFISKATVSVWNSANTSLGYVSHATLYGGATMSLGCYGMASDTIVSGGSVTVTNGGKIQGTTVHSGSSNRITLMTGASAHITTLFSGAGMFVSQGASATTNKISSGGTLHIEGYAQYNSVMVGMMYVSKTGKASATYVSSGGTLYVVGSANEVTVSSGGSYVTNGSAWTTSVTVSSGGTMIAGSGTVDGLKVFNGTVSAGAGARVSHAVFDSGVIEIKSAGTATSLTLNSGARAIVSAGGTASFTELNSNAQLILSNCYAFSTTVNKGGSVTVSNGGKANTVTLNSSGSMTVSMGGAASHVTVNDSAVLTLYGLASSAMLQSGASLYIGSGGSMDSATVNAGANVVVAANGMGYDLLEDGGYVDVKTNGSALFRPHTFTGTIQSATVHKNTTASDVIVSKRLDVFSGGIANNTTVAGSGAFVIVNDGGKANYATLTGSSSYIALSSGASALHVVLSNSKARLIVSSGGSVNEIIVFSGGTASIFGSASDTIIHSGYLGISSGASATQATALSAGAYIVVNSGGRANGITIANSAAGATVYSSGTATNTIVYAGSFTVLNGGKAELTSANGTINLNGGSANNTLVGGGGTMNVNVNGLANSTTINGKGTMFVNSYGSATSNSVSKGGSMAILSAGSVRYTSVFSGGEFSVSRGGFASTTVVSAYGSFTVSSGGRATYSLVRDGGSMTVMNGGSASDINLDGSLFVHGVADSAQVNGAGAAMTVFNGGSAVNAVVGNGAALTVSSGGKITGRLVTTAEAVVSAYAGAILDFDLTKTEAGADALVNNLSIFTGATPSYTLTVDGTVADGEYKLAEGASGFTGTISVVNVSGATLGTLDLDTVLTIDDRNYLLSRNGSTLAVTIDGGSGVFVFSGELNNSEKNVGAGVSAVNVSVNKNSFLNILNGAKASGTTVNEGGGVTVYDGGAGSGFTVNQGGTVHVANGAVATDILENGGSVGVDHEATATFLPNTFSGLLLEGEATAHSGTVANQTAVNDGGDLRVYDGGVANDTAVNDNGSLILMEDGAAANNTTVGNGSFTIYGGVANGATVNDGGVFENRAGAANDTTVNDGGTFNLIATASNTTVKAGGQLVVLDSAGSAGRLTGKMTFEDGAIVSCHSEKAVIDFDLTQTAPNADALLNDLSAIQGETPLFTLTVDGTDATGDYMLADGVDYFGKTVAVLNTAGEELGELDLFQVVTIGGREYLLSRGESGLYVTLGGVSSFTGSVNTTTKNLLSGMSASEVNVNKDGLLNVYSGGAASGIDVNKDGHFGVESGGEAKDATVNNGGAAQIFDGGAGSGFTVNPGGRLYVYDGAAVTDILENGGFVDSYGEATMTFLPNTFSGLVLENLATVHSGTVAAQTTVKSGGELRIYDGGVANDAIVNYSGSFVLDEKGGGVANNTTVNNGGVFINYNGTANGATIDGGGVFATYSGAANGITVSEGGLFALYTDGTASDTTVKAGGELQFLGKLTGRTTIEAGATAFIEFEGAVIDFDLTRTATDADALLNDLSAIQGETPRFTLTVDGTQDAGDYKLAGGAGGFAGSLTVVNTSGMELGSLTVDGGSLKTALGEYSLSLNDGMLTATVAAEVVPDTTKPTVSNITASATDPTNQDVVVTAEFRDDVELKSALYRIGDGEWQDYQGGVTVTENGTTVYFKAIDATGNESDIASYDVTNIDRIPPAKPTASADVTTPTNQDVTVTAEFSEDSAKREFSTDGRNWLDYVDGVKLSANGAVHFRGVDAAGNASEVTSVEVGNIDRIPPAKPTASADVTEPTTGSVFVSAVFSKDSVRKEFSRDEVNWLPYDGAVKFTANGAAYFRGIDAAGNVSEVASCEVDNIEAVAPDTTKPTVSNIAASATDPTNQDVTVTAVFADDVALKSSLYRIGNGEWQDYQGGVTVTENATVYFKAIDATGNESDEAGYAVTNIDKVAPTISGITPDTTAPAESVTLTTTFADDVALASKQFKIGGGGAWQDYAGGVTVTENATVYFRAVDTAGNETESSFEVTNIEAAATDTTPPVVASMQASTNAPTNQDVIVTATFEDDVSVASALYCINNGEWKPYPDGGVVVTENATVYFQAVDTAGNKSEIDAYKLTNIDKVAPTITITPSTTDPAKSVDVIAKFADNVKLVDQQYRIGDDAWANCIGGVATVTENNTTVYFRATDTAGNETVESYTVTNIDDSMISKGIEEPLNDWLYDKKEKRVNAALTGSAGTKLVSSAPSARIIFDATPSETQDNFVGQDAEGTPDECDYAKIVLDHAAELSFGIHYTDAAKFTVWQLIPDKKKAGVYSVKSVQATTLKNKSATLTEDGTKPIRLEAGEYYLSMQSTNAKKGGKNDYSVGLANATVFDRGDNSDDWTNMKTVGYGPGAEIDDLGVVDGNGALVENEWTGFGDSVDCKKFTLASAAKLSFAFSTLGDDNLKFSICQLKSSEKNGVVTYSQGWNKSATVKARNSAGTGSLNDLLLEAGEYYIKVENTNAKKSSGTDYGVKIAQSDFYSDGDSGANDFDSKAKTVSAEVRGEVAALNAGKTLQLDGALAADAGLDIDHDGFTNFVGFGDDSDVVRIGAVAGDSLSLKVTSTDAVSLTLYGLKDGKVKSIKSVKSKNNVATIDDFTFQEKNGSEFYVGVTATNAKKGEAAWYNVEVTSFSGAASDALAMPETDDTAVRDDLYFIPCGTESSASGLAAGVDINAFASPDGENVRWNAPLLA